MFWNFVLYIVFGLVAVVIESVIQMHCANSEYGDDGIDLMLEAFEEVSPTTESLPVAIIMFIWGIIIWPIRLIQVPYRMYRVYDKMNELMESKNEEVTENE